MSGLVGALPGVAVMLVAQASAIELPIGTPVTLETTVELSSRSHVKGDIVPLRVATDVLVHGTLIVRAGTEAVGQVVDAQAKGAMGMSGRIVVRPLYAKVGGRIVRLSGQSTDAGSVTAGAVLGTVALTMPVFTGRSAMIPAGTRFTGMVEKTVRLMPLS